MREWIVLVVCAVATACGPAPAVPATGGGGLVMTDLVFLTRDGCANTPLMRANVDVALRSMGLEPAYQVLDLAQLPDTDARRGYPTPTLLYAGQDVFGMEQPAPPYPDPT